MAHNRFHTGYGWKKWGWLVVSMLLAACTPEMPERPINTSVPSPSPTAFQVATATIVPTELPTVAVTATPVPTLIPTLSSRAISIPIIEYHYPSFFMTDQVQMQPAWFGEQIQWLADEGYTTLGAEDLIAFVNGERSFPERSIVLSFDLGTARYSDYADGVIPLLRQYNFQAIFFILVNNSVIRDDCTHPENVFCWDDLRGWVDEGLISIGSHGLNHPDYATQSAEAIRQDMVLSRQILEEKMDMPVQVLAYPYDSSPSIAQQIVRDSGYLLAISGNNRPDTGVLVDDPQRYYLPRLYPYSSPGLYPLLYAYKRTFAEMVSTAGE